MPSGCIIDSAAYKRIATIIAIIMAVFQIIVAGYGFIVTNMRCAIHLTFAITLVGMYKPVRFKSNILTDTYNIAFTLLSIVCGIFLTYETRADYALTYTLNGPSQMDVIVGTILIVMSAVRETDNGQCASDYMCHFYTLCNFWPSSSWIAYAQGVHLAQYR